MRLSRNGRCVTVKHAVPLSSVRTPADGRRLLTLIQHPLPQVRLAGDNAYDAGESNPYADPDSAESVNWEAGNRDARQRNS